MKSRVRSRVCDSKALIRMGVLLPILVHIILASSGSGVFARDTISLNSGWTVSTEYESECFIGRESASLIELYSALMPITCPRILYLVFTRRY